MPAVAIKAANCLDSPLRPLILVAPSVGHKKPRGLSPAIERQLNPQALRTRFGLAIQTPRAGADPVFDKPKGAVRINEVGSPSCAAMHGHTGIVGENGVIYSNSSATGRWAH
jgi:hypothetical protein